MIAFDIETTGVRDLYALQPWRVAAREAWITSWAVASSDTVHATLAPQAHEDVKVLLTALVEQWVARAEDVAVWNGLFEVAWLAQYVPLPLLARVRWVDGMLLYRHLTNAPVYAVNPPVKTYGLKAAVAKFFPDAAGYEQGITFDGSTHPLVLMAYNAADARYTLQLVEMFVAQMQGTSMLRAARVEAACLFDIALANTSGIVVNKHDLDALDAMLVDRQRALTDKLQASGVTEQVAASPVQLRRVLYEQWALPVLRHAKTGPSTAKQVLHELAHQDSRAGLLQDLRAAKGDMAKYVTATRACLDYNRDGRVRPQARVFGTYTGRVTYSSEQGKGVKAGQVGIAIHQIRRDAAYRRMFRPEDGHVMVEFDAAGQEFRWMAIASGDESMLALCQPGEDAHAYMGAHITGLSYAEVREGAHSGDKRLKEVRQLGKVANLSCQYRTSAERLLEVARIQYHMDMQIDVAQRIHAAYRRAYPGVVRYWQRQVLHVNRYLYVETLAGRRVTMSRLDLAKSEWSVHSTAINYPVQGTGADQKYLAIAATRGIVRRHGARLLFDLHDGLYYSCPRDCVDEFVAQMRAALATLPYEQAWGLKPPIPLPFDAKVGTSWGDLREV